MKSIKAIMCDVDGTLLTSKQVVSDYTIEAIKKAKSQGFLFGLSTGRDVDSVKVLLKPWGIEGLVDIIVGSGGAEIYDYTLNIYEQNYPLAGEFIKEIMNHFSDLDVNFTIPCNGDLMTPKDDKLIQDLAIADGVNYKVIDFNEFLKQPQLKLVIVCDEETMKKVIERSKTFHNDQYKCASLKTASTLFEYMDPRVSKTNGLIKALSYHGLTLNELCSFGDADNDYDMTLNAKVGVAMANGSDKTKSAADFITDDNDHDGIGKFIIEHLL